MQRKCPSKIANDFKLNDIRIGLDNKYWIVKKRKNNTKYWKRYNNIGGKSKLKPCDDYDGNEKVKCYRKSDKKIFTLPRKFKKKDCIKSKIKGFSMKSSCAPWLNTNKEKIKKK